MGIERISNVNRTFDLHSIHIRFAFDSHSISVKFNLKTFDSVWVKNEAAL